MINVTNVNKSFEDGKVLKEVSLSVKKGSIYGLLGSNGAGKTTLLKILAGIYREDSGIVTIDNQHVYENVNMKDNVFFIPDIPYFFPQYTIKQMAQFYKGVYSYWSDDRYKQLAEIFDLNINKKISSFSKGLQRQAAFWLALSTMPDVLILDEPMDGLDPVVRKKVKNVLIQEVAQRGMTIVISSHNLREIEDISDHVAILHNGSILVEKELDDLKSDIHKVQLAFKDGIPDGFTNELELLHSESRGSVLLLIARGNEENLESIIEKFNPVIFDILPLTLEEIFIYEMGDAGYAIKNILV